MVYAAAFGALKNIFTDKYLSEELKGEVYKALILPTLLYGCEAYFLREDLFKRLCSSHNKCALNVPCEFTSYLSSPYHFL